jgi:hypothetical protein
LYCHEIPKSNGVGEKAEKHIAGSPPQPADFDQRKVGLVNQLVRRRAAGLQDSLNVLDRQKMVVHAFPLFFVVLYDTAYTYNVHHI